MDVVFVVLLLGVVGVVAALLAGRVEARLGPATVSRPMVTLPAQDVAAGDIEALRFSLGLRGYRMDEVDAVLDRLATQITELRQRVVDQDHQIATLRASVFRRDVVAADAMRTDQVAERPSGEQASSGLSARPPKESTDG